MASRSIFMEMCHEDVSCPVFDHLQYAKTERKAYEISHPMDDLSMSTWVERKGEVSPTERARFIICTHSFCPKQAVSFSFKIAQILSLFYLQVPR